MCHEAGFREGRRDTSSPGGLGLQRLRLTHSVENPASCRVAERAGFALEGTMRSALLHEDGWHDEHLHARVRGDAWPGERTGSNADPMG